MKIIIASLLLFAACFAMQVGFAMWEHPLFEAQLFDKITGEPIEGATERTDLGSRTHGYLGVLTISALIGFALSLFDRVAGGNLSLGWAIATVDAPPILRAAVVAGWSYIAASFVEAFSYLMR